MEYQNNNKRQRQNSTSQTISLYKRILFQKIRFQNQFEDQEPLQNDLLQSNQQSSSQYIYGVVQNFKLSINEDKKKYGLQDQGKCYQFTLNEKYLIVIVNNIPNIYPKGTPISLYLPPSMIQGPQKMIGNYQLVIIRPYHDIKDENIMLYPYIMVEPTQYLHPTYICSWLDCQRYVSLKQYLKQKFQIQKTTTLGNVCHKFLEYLLDNLTEVSNKKFFQLESKIKQIYNLFLYEFYVIRKQQHIIIDFEVFFKECKISLQNIHNWVVKHIINKQPIEDGEYPHISVKITQVIGSETMHKSKYFGLKGKTDGLFKGIRTDSKKKISQIVLIPFELKSGHKTPKSHKQQLDIYNILLRENYNLPTIGILYYSQKNMAILRPEKVNLAFFNIILNRNTALLDLNQLFLGQNIHLPKFPRGNPCKVCKIATTCEVFYINQKLTQVGRNYYKKKYLPEIQNAPQNQEKDKQRKEMMDMFDQMDEQEQTQKEKPPSDENANAKFKIQNLRYPELKYIQKWMVCLHSEQRQGRLQKLKRQKNKCNVFFLLPTQLIKIRQFVSIPRLDDQRLKITVQKRIHSVEEFQALKTSFKTSQKIRIKITYLGLEQNCKIILTKRESSVFYMDLQFTKKQIVYSSGYLEKGIKDNFTCEVEAQNYDNQSFSSLRSTVFEFVTGNNEDLKKLVIEEYNPRLVVHTDHNQQSKIFQVQVSPADYNSQGKIFNRFQEQAFRKTFSSQYCTLVEGMPGTGKTELIVKIIEKCYKQELKVLVTTFTNRSLDNIINRIRKNNIVQEKYLIRQGSKQGIDPKLLKYNSSSQRFADIHQYKNYFDSKLIWFVTLSSVSSPHIPKDFDLVILDEASQSLEPSCIEALTRGKKILLIGDYKQLQPIVKSRKAISDKMNISLFEKLCRSQGQTVASLCVQYRMNQEIMKLSNTLVYSGLLQLDPEQRQHKKIKLCKDWMSKCIIQDVINIMNPLNPVVFLNHDFLLKAYGKLNNQKQQIMHILEVEMAIFLLKKLIQLEVNSQDIAIVCVYNKTVDEIKSYLQKNTLTLSQNQRRFNDKQQSQVLTIDKSQGIDKQAIILLAESRERTNNSLLQDSKRFNVALTRAKTKLIIIGSMEYLEQPNSVFDGRLPELLRGKCQLNLEYELVDHVLKSFDQQIKG